MNSRLITLNALMLAFSVTFAWGQVTETILGQAGANRAEIERAIETVDDAHRADLLWMIEHMPAKDLESLDADFLLENIRLARQAWETAPWHDQVDVELYRDAILPYACVNETRERWRHELRETARTLIANSRTISEAATRLNRELFNEVGVRYSTGRKKPDQSPSESMETGLASCTGLTILLVDACRSVGVPARFTGTALWSDESGNHSWAEIWDGDWHFTGAAEPTGDELNKAWFTGRASKANREDPRKAIYSVTWRKTPLHFPMVWRPDDRTINAVDVTDRYTTSASELPEGSVRARFRVLDENGRRIARDFTVTTDEGKTFTLRSRDEGFDSNDHVELILPIGTPITWDTDGAQMTTEIVRDEQLVTIMVPNAPIEAPVAQEVEPKASKAALDGLRKWLARPGEGDLADQAFASVPLTKVDDEKARRMLWDAHRKVIRAERRSEMKDRSLTIGNHTMPFWYTTYGEKPKDGRSLWISMHGGGGAPEELNTQQWNNQKRLYQPEEGVYLAPRAPTNTWNLWHQGHIDPMFDRLIENLIVFEDVNPDKIYVMGYSAGGDGVYQLAPRMADRWAAAAMMAGHPNDARPESLRNTAFTLHMGANDTPFKRNEVAAQWKTRLAELQAEDSGGYDHWVEIHEDKGHWMDREDASAVPWMAQRTRNLRPKHVVWRQDDVTHDRSYWLAVDEPVRGKTITATASNQWVQGQTVTLNSDSGPLRIRLDDELFDLDAPVRVRRAGETLHESLPTRTIGTLHRTLAERGDPRGMFSSEILIGN